MEDSIEFTLTQIQEKIDIWIKNNGGYWPPLAMLASIMEEVGELSREINHLEKFKPKKNAEKEDSLPLEIGDILFSITCIANYYDINLSTAVRKSIEKYTKRDSGRFTKGNS